ncbi:hypothetical protein RHGRI_033132 [Rhododendron griersonianum]|uniref:Transposase n=1 Tax=Rhododendron griersonianum TaxID=479676 RepID=A0AAV6HVI1_9ERIC|nr:hypothetical protein RHGRI_038901 [Rhododendron griersonianum]KAG5520441.1 hypothetical protein RHGRI_033132 [Rhododendron griersonianum]
MCIPSGIQSSDAAALTGRAPSDMTYIVDAVGSTIAWPADFVILDSSSPGYCTFTLLHIEVFSRMLEFAIPEFMHT